MAESSRVLFFSFFVRAESGDHWLHFVLFESMSLPAGVSPASGMKEIDKVGRFWTVEFEDGMECGLFSN